jgi:transcription elongation GreA/GreB family factor
VEQRLREARPYGEGSNNDEYHAVREEQMVLEARLAALENTVAHAVVVDADDAARAPDVISAASPMGQALMGARPGAVVTVDLPNRRSRTVRLVAVKTPPQATGGA